MIFRRISQAGQRLGGSSSRIWCRGRVLFRPIRRWHFRENGRGQIPAPAKRQSQNQNRGR